jgi:hypothetical protein
MALAEDHIYPIFPRSVKRNVERRVQIHSRQKVQGDQKVSVHLMITIQKITSNVQNASRQSPDIY